VIYDTDGPGSTDQWGTSVVHLDGVAAAGLTSASLFGLGDSPPPTSPPPPPPPPPAPPPAGIVNVDPTALPLSGAATGTISTGKNGTLTGTPRNDLLDGHGAYHVMSGAGGDDTFAVYLGSDVVTEKAGQGIDTVWSYAPSYTLASNVENGVIKAAGHDTLTGNALANDLRSNDGGSLLNGGAGADWLHAGAGADTLTGGAGADVFEYSKLPSAAGQVTDFTPGADVLDLRGLFAAAHYSGNNPLADGHIQVLDDGAGNTRVLFDADGSAGAGAAVLVTTLDHVAAATLKAGVDWVFA
jgi:Ca2+-binding RTX toxin-like protein